MNWVDTIVASTIEAESPERYQYWASLAALAASLKKNVFLDRYFYKLYPNIYVILVGKSGLRKGNPVTLSKKLVQEAKVTRVVTGRASIQAIIKEIGKAVSIEGGGVLKDASAYLVSGEAASFLVKDPEALTILTDLYDTNAHEPEWKNMLKSSGTDVLKNPCITFLWATNEDHFKEAVAEKDVKGGFLARSLVILEDKRRTINDLLDPPKTTPIIADLACYLKEVSKLNGEFTLEAAAKALYRNWYKQLATLQHEDKTGTVERIGDTVLKVAMLLSVADSFDLIIREGHMDEAISKSIDCLGGLKMVSMGAGGGELNRETALVLKYILDKPDLKTTRKKILSKYWGEFDSLVLDRVVETLVQAGAIESERIGKDMVYTMPQKIADAYRTFKTHIN